MLLNQPGRPRRAPQIPPPPLTFVTREALYELGAGSKFALMTLIRTDGGRDDSGRVAVGGFVIGIPRRALVGSELGLAAPLRSLLLRLNLSSPSLGFARNAFENCGGGLGDASPRLDARQNCSRALPAMREAPRSVAERFWRRRRDSNPRNPFGFTGFRDRPDQPLQHPSAVSGGGIIAHDPIQFPHEQTLSFQVSPPAETPSDGGNNISGATYYSCSAGVCPRNEG